MKNIAGISSATRRLTAIAVSVRSRLAASKRRLSCAPRSKARITRTPVRPSSSTRFSLSILTCISWNSGTALRMIRKNTIARIGITAISTRASRASCDSDSDDAADRHHRRRDDHAQHHDQHLLHLRGVVGRARDERRGAEVIELVHREVRHAIEDRGRGRRGRSRWRPSTRSSCRPTAQAVPTSATSSIRPPRSGSGACRRARCRDRRCRPSGAGDTSWPATAPARARVRARRSPETV